MPEDRSNPPAPEAAAPAVKARASFKPFLPLLLTVLLMPVLAWGMTRFVILPQLQKELAGGGSAPAAATAKSKADIAKEKTVTLPMNKLLVNVEGTLGARYLMVNLAVVGSGADFKTKLDDHDAQLRDMACGVLGSKSLADLEKPGEKNLIRNELIAGFNNILGDSTVQEIYFPEFAIQ
jgi:flagellar FliL protein